MKPALTLTILTVLATTGIFMRHAITPVVAQTQVSAPGINDPVNAGKPAVASIETARQIATILHESMHSALQITHDRYYREDEGLMIPAAALQEVFDEIESKRKITLRWLVVEGQAMNIDHEANDDFEKAAVKALISGKASHEETTATIYRRAAPITLSNHCLKCHVPDRRNTNDRKAGLIVSIPIASM